MNLWEKILGLSGLPECRSIKDHLCNISKANGVARVFGNYKVKYIPTVTGVIKYLNRPVLKASYLNKKEIIVIKYTPTEPSDIKYILKNRIKIKYICKQ